MLTLALFIVLFMFLVINVPVAVSIGFTSVLFFIFLGDAGFLAMFPNRMYYGIVIPQKKYQLKKA
ncbi:MAG: hypothetical protein LBH70_10585 [Spirochaetaceae bacterium]|jgi:hypothetical protein|nr:hypothetical protein [Spirochaetaceae bacterium]